MEGLLPKATFGSGGLITGDQSKIIGTNVYTDKETYLKIASIPSSYSFYSEIIDIYVIPSQTGGNLREYSLIIAVAGTGDYRGSAYKIIGKGSTTADYKFFMDGNGNFYIKTTSGYLRTIIKAASPSSFVVVEKGISVDESALEEITLG